jgi:hypothetical protein
MSQRLVSAVWAALVGALSGVVLLGLFYLLSPALHIEFEIDPPRLMTGMHRGERDEATGLTFAWTGRDVALRLPGLDRRVPWTATVRVRGARTEPAGNPMIVFFVDGVQALAHQSGTDFDEVQVPVPVRSERPRGAIITMQSSATFVPGPNDQRPLGVMFDAVTVAPDGLALPPWPAFGGAAAAAAALGAAIALLGVTPGLAVGSAVLVGTGAAAVLSRGFAPYTDYPELVAQLAITVSIGLVAIVLAIERIRRQPLRNTARFALAFTATALFLKLLVLLHPNMPLGDALFQAHRFQTVLRGNYYFTSIAPGNYLFPYAPGLYVAAMPFADLVTREAGDVVLLRLFVTTVDAIMGALLYLVVVRGWGDRLAAAVAAAVYQLLPLNFQIIAAGNLTNAFAQSLAVAAFAVICASWLRLGRIASVALLTCVLAAAFLSHTGTFAILAATACALAIAYAWRGGPELRSPAAAVLVAAVAAIAIAVVLYYAHFIETYRTEFARIGSETATAAADAGGRSIGARARIVPLNLHTYIGAPVMILAVWGAVSLYRRGARDRLTLALGASAITCIAFLAIGIVTPVDMRHYLAALPTIAIAAGAAVSHNWSSGGRGRVAAVTLLAWLIWIAVTVWLRTLR